MIRLLPVPPDRLPDLCRGKGLDQSGGVTAYAAWQGEGLLGWYAIGEGDPCPVLGLEAEDASLADGLLRAALFPRYRQGAKGYRFHCPPACPLPKGYTTAGEGALALLFAPCD